MNLSVTPSEVLKANFVTAIKARLIDNNLAPLAMVIEQVVLVGDRYSHAKDSLSNLAEENRKGKPLTAEEIKTTRELVALLVEIADQDGVKKSEVRKHLYSSNSENAQSLDQVVGFSAETQKELRSLRKSIHDTSKKVEEMKLYNGEQLIQMAKPIIEASEKNLRVMRLRIENIVGSDDGIVEKETQSVREYKRPKL